MLMIKSFLNTSDKFKRYSCFFVQSTFNAVVVQT